MGGQRCVSSGSAPTAEGSKNELDTVNAKAVKLDGNAGTFPLLVGKLNHRLLTHTVDVTKHM